MKRKFLYSKLLTSINWVRGREPVLLVAVFVMAATSWAFIKVASEVLEGETAAFDKWAVRVMRRADDPAVPIGPEWMQEIGRDATALGGAAALSLFTMIVAGYLWIGGKRRMMWFLLASTISGLFVSLSLKHFISRPRPDIVPHLSNVHTSSFPSGHSMLSAVVYLTLGSLLAAVIPRMWLKIYVLAVAAILTGIVGVSRVYLGVHYPTDVLAGWMAGLVWSLSCWLIARWLQREKKVETDSLDDEPE